MADAMMDVTDATALTNFDPPVSLSRHRRIRGEWVTGDLVLTNHQLRWHARGRHNGQVTIELSEIDRAVVTREQKKLVRSTAVDLRLRDGNVITVVTQGADGLIKALISTGVTTSRDSV